MRPANLLLLGLVLLTRHVALADDSVASLARLAAAPRSHDREALRAALLSEDPLARYWAARGLGNLGPQAAALLPDLERTLADRSPSVRIAAARACLQLGPSEKGEVALLAELMSDSEWNRLLAISTLAEFPALAAGHRPRLAALLEKETNDYVQRIARRLTKE